MLQVGHLERFNAAILAAEPHISAPRFMECQRLAPYKERGTDVNVVLDLMIHDIDLVQSLAGSEIVSIDAIGSPVFSGEIDIANARIRFANGCVANTTASRVSMKTERKLRIFEDAAYISLDLQQKILTLIRKRDARAGTRAAAGEHRRSESRAGRRAEERNRVVPGLHTERRAVRWCLEKMGCAHSRPPSASPSRFTPTSGHSGHRLEGAARRTYICRMNTPIRPLNDVRRTLDIDLVADFTCPWSWLGMAQLTRALGNLSGDVETRLRWHPFRMATATRRASKPRSFHDYLAERLPPGISVPFAEKSLTEAGRELGIEFHFEKLGRVAEYLRSASAGPARGG